jgi:small-conductance mechanosensitive channel
MRSAFDGTIASVRQALSWLPDWLSAVIILALLTGAALACHALALRLIRQSRLGRSRTAKLVMDRGAGPSRAAFVVFGVGAAIPALGLSSDATGTLLRLDFAAFLLILGWAGVALVSLAGDLYLARLPRDFEQDALARKHVTQIRVLRRTSQVLLGLLSVAAALMTQPGIEQYGLSLFASAGAAGIVVGLAARPVLSNLLAGIQIAITQPIKVEDAVVVEGEWGWIEDITSTYVVIRLWDWRRLVVPLSWFLEQPFQNWTRESSSLIGSVHLFVDYATPIDALRQQMEVIVRQSKLWDGNVLNLQVVEATEQAIQLRVLVSARNSSEAWDLRCHVREKLIAFLQEKMPHALPRHRVGLAPAATADENLADIAPLLSRKAGS